MAIALIQAKCKVCSIIHTIQVDIGDIFKHIAGQDIFGDLNFELQFLVRVGICWDCWEKRHE